MVVVAIYLWKRGGFQPSLLDIGNEGRNLITPVTLARCVFRTVRAWGIAQFPSQSETCIKQSSTWDIYEQMTNVTDGEQIFNIYFLFPVLILMKELKSLSLDTYERLWKRLDKKPAAAKKGDFKRVAAEFMYTQEDIWELEKELTTSGSGSPARQLLDGLETRRPELTVLEFVKVLQKPNIRRDDIVELLNDYIFHSQWQE